jgi:hypothetical protein
MGFLYLKSKDEKRAELCINLYEEFANNLIKFDKTLQDEYMLRLAKVKFMQKKYNECH